MSRRLLILNGLAIVAVVLNHAAGWGVYQVTSGTMSYYIVLAIEKLADFAVPAFLFVSGFFVAYAAQGNNSISWKTVRTRITTLLIPYVIWSTVFFVCDALTGSTYGPWEYLRRLVTGEAAPPYFYVPLIIQFYLLSPWIAAWAKTNGKRLLVLSALFQYGVMIVHYVLLLGANAPALDLLTRLTPYWTFFTWIFFFSFGVVYGARLRELQSRLARFKWYLLVAVVILGALAILETEVIYRLTGTDQRGSPLTILASFYAIAFILCFLSFDKVSIPFSRTIQQLGAHSYGIYLVHPLVLLYIPHIAFVMTWMMAHPRLYLPIVVILAIGIPYLLMTIVAKTWARRSYRYLFG
jgi:probable poly-beta-1,6-N-acetyl-D-glucosamine export protein